MTRDQDPPFERSSDIEPDHLLEGIVADEDGADKTIFWRLSAWGVAAVAAVTVSVLAGRSSYDPWTVEAHAKFVESKTAQVETVSRETQFEARRLAAAIDTLNSDRDRIFARLSSVEQGFESVTGAIKTTEPAPPKVAARPPESAMLSPLGPSAPPAVEPSNPAPIAAKPAQRAETFGQTASIEPLPDAWSMSDRQKPADTIVRSTEFGVDLGASTTLDGLRTIWRTTSGIHKAALAGLTPIVTIQERGANQPMLLRLVAGPLRNAADASRLCLLLMENAKDCKASVFEGQKLQLTEAPTPTPAKRPVNRAPKQSTRPFDANLRSAVTVTPSQLSLLPSSGR